MGYCSGDPRFRGRRPSTERTTVRTQHFKEEQMNRPGEPTTTRRMCRDPYPPSRGREDGRLPASLSDSLVDKQTIPSDVSQGLNPGPHSTDIVVHFRILFIYHRILTDMSTCRPVSLGPKVSVETMRDRPSETRSRKRKDSVSK